MKQASKIDFSVSPKFMFYICFWFDTLSMKGNISFRAIHKFFGPGNFEESSFPLLPN